VLKESLNIEYVHGCWWRIKWPLHSWSGMYGWFVFITTSPSPEQTIVFMFRRLTTNGEQLL